MDEYDIILLGYPNWWASIPMPIAKLAPEATMGEGLSVHYSGGSDLPEDVEKWLDSNGIKP